MKQRMFVGSCVLDHRPVLGWLIRWYEWVDGSYTVHITVQYYCSYTVLCNMYKVLSTKFYTKLAQLQNAG